jgi:uncharacterized membrane protein
MERSRALPVLGAFTWLLTCATLPVLLWHRVLRDIVASFRWSFTYVASELSPWLLLLAGIAFMLPVAASVGLSRESRLYPRARRVYAGWGIVLYLLGLLLAIEVAEVWRYSH